MSTYTDVYVIPVPTEQLDAYRKLADLSSRVWREHGALSYVEVVADDVKIGKWTSFPQAVSQQPGETIIVAIITYRSRAHRDEVNGKAMADPRMTGYDVKSIPFDGKRMFFGGFAPLVG